MEKIQNNLAEEVLEHHGILGMKWGLRRYQPYPSDYSGDGKFVGKREARKQAKAEKREARHQAKVQTKIRNAVDTGNKKALKKLKDEMTPQEYEKKYDETVRNGINNAVQDRSTSDLRKYKDDLTTREYKHQKDRIKFKEAIDNDKNKKANRLLSKVDPEDVAEATDFIKSRVALQDQKLSKIRQDSELMARMDKLNSGVAKVSKFATNVSSITSSFMDINKKITEYSSAAKDAADKEEKRKLNNIIKSGDVTKIEQYKDKMDYNQLKEAYGKAYVMNSRAIDKAIADGNLNEIYKRMPWMNAEDMSKIITKIKNLESRGAAFSDDISYEDVLAHHGILGMHWGIRRFQPYPKGYKGDGKEIGQAKRVGLGDKKYQNYDVSFAKQGSTIRKKTKYTNIDGSLNEKGKLHAQKYISKQIEKNEKYYAKEIAKYEKKAEKYKESNPEMSEKFKAMAKDAERSRDHVNESIKQMAIDEIMTNESEDRQRAIKAIKTAAGVTVGAATGGAVLAGGLGLSSALSTSENFERAKTQAEWEFNNAKAQFKLSEPIDSVMRITQTSPIAAKAENFVENTIRTYADARSYVLGISLDQAANRLTWADKQYGISGKYGEIVGNAGKTALDNMGINAETINQLNTLANTTGKVTNSVINNPNTSKLISATATSVNDVLSNPGTMNMLNELNNAVGSANTNINVSAPTVSTSGAKSFVDAGTLGTLQGLNSAVNSALSNPNTQSITRQAYIMSQPDTLTDAQREYYRKNNVG